MDVQHKKQSNREFVENPIYVGVGNCIYIRYVARYFCDGKYHYRY